MSFTKALFSLFAITFVVGTAQAANLNFTCQNGARYEFTQVELRGTTNTTDRILAGMVTLAHNGARVNGGVVIPKDACVANQAIRMECGDKLYEFNQVALAPLLIGGNFMLVGQAKLARNNVALGLELLVPSDLNCVLTAN
jgi:hypothetical protein